MSAMRTWDLLCDLGYYLTMAASIFIFAVFVEAFGLWGAGFLVIVTLLALWLTQRWQITDQPVRRLQPPRPRTSGGYMAGGCSHAPPPSPRGSSRSYEPLTLPPPRQ